MDHRLQNRTLAAAVVAALAAALSAAPIKAAPTSPAPDPREVETMLIEAGYSAVASLRLVDRQWVGVGAHDGLVVDFVVDARTLRLLHEVTAH
jgi:hypothetical protein